MAGLSRNFSYFIFFYFSSALPPWHQFYLSQHVCTDSGVMHIAPTRILPQYLKGHGGGVAHGVYVDTGHEGQQGLHTQHQRDQWLPQHSVVRIWQNKKTGLLKSSDYSVYLLIVSGICILNLYFSSTEILTLNIVHTAGGEGHLGGLGGRDLLCPL